MGVAGPVPIITVCLSVCLGTLSSLQSAVGRAHKVGTPMEATAQLPMAMANLMLCCLLVVGPAALAVSSAYSRPHSCTCIARIAVMMSSRPTAKTSAVPQEPSSVARREHVHCRMSAPSIKLLSLYSSFKVKVLDRSCGKATDA